MIKNNRKLLIFLKNIKLQSGKNKRKRNIPLGNKIIKIVNNQVNKV